MKRVLMMAAVCGAVLGRQVQAQNLILNGDFELGVFVQDGVTNTAPASSGSTPPALPGSDPGSTGTTPVLPGNGSSTSTNSVTLPGSGGGSSGPAALPGSTSANPMRMTIGAGATTISNWIAGISSGHMNWLKSPDYNAESGNYSLDLGNAQRGTGGYVEQTFATTAGLSYQVSAYLASEGNGGPSTINMLINGNVIGSISVGSGAPSAGLTYTNLTWTPVTYNFQAASPVSTLRIQDATSFVDVNPIIDNVSVIQTALSIQRQPASLTTSPARAGTLAVTAAGDGPLAYQWKLNGASIAGATNSSLVLSPLTFSEAGSYTVVVTGPTSSVVSDAAVISLVDLKIASGIANLSIAGPAAFRYRVESAASVAPASWTLLTNATLNATSFSLSDAASASNRFYRVTPLGP